MARLADLATVALRAAITLWLGVLGSSGVQAQSFQEGVRPNAETAELVAALNICFDLMKGEADPAALLPTTDWNFDAEQGSNRGADTMSFIARSREVRIMVNYDVGVSCGVSGDVIKAESDTTSNQSESNRRVVEDIRDALRQEHGFRGISRGSSGGPMILTDDFKMDFFILSSMIIDGSTFHIKVSVPTQSTVN